MSAQLSVTHTSQVTEDQIDQLGHMNVRFYGVNAAAGTRSMLDQLGVPETAPLVDLHTRHHNEQLLGSELEVRSGLVDVGRGLAIYHELRNADSEDLAATFIQVLDSPRLEAPTTTIPEHGRPRTLDLTTDPIGSAPPLAEIQQPELELRAPRVLEQPVTAATASSLFWGELPSEAEQRDWIQRGPNGERMAWATMESRLTINRLPPVGARVQSFGATTAIERKTTRSTRWVYDLEQGDVLVTFDLVNLAFDLDQRRSMLVPDDYLVRERRQFRPEFIPSSPTSGR